jgi:hypothetical protein
MIISIELVIAIKILIQKIIQEFEQNENCI